MKTFEPEQFFTCNFHPIVVIFEHMNLGEILGILYNSNIVPICITTDRDNEMFEEIRLNFKNQGIKEKVTAIVFTVQYSEPFLT